MKEPIHGKYTVEVSGNLLINRYSEGFNDAGIRALAAEILDKASQLKKWVLLQLPEESAGLIQSSIPVMFDAYLEFQNKGCLGVGIHKNSIFVGVGDFCEDPELTMPIRIDEDSENLKQWLESLI